MALPARRPSRSSGRSASAVAARTPLDAPAPEHPLAAARGMLLGGTIAVTAFWGPLALAIWWLRA